MIGANALFTDVNRPIQWEFEYLAEKVYKSAVYPVNFMNPSASVSIINQWVANITQNRIVQLVLEGRITRLLFSALHDVPLSICYCFLSILILFASVMEVMNYSFHKSNSIKAQSPQHVVSKGYSMRQINFF